MDLPAALEMMVASVRAMAVILASLGLSEMDALTSQEPKAEGLWGNFKRLQDFSFLSLRNHVPSPQTLGFWCSRSGGVLAGRGHVTGCSRTGTRGRPSCGFGSPGFRVHRRRICVNPVRDVGRCRKETVLRKSS